MGFRRLLCGAAITSCLSAPWANAQGELTGLVALDSRFFAEGPGITDQKMSNGPTLVIEPEYYYSLNNDNDVFTIRPFARLDPYDEKRNHFDIRQLDWLHVDDSWELRAGASKVFWGVTESNHLVDIINQTDAIEDVDGEDKLGQPMVQFGWFQHWGNVRLFYLPYFRQRTFSDRTGRLRTSLPVETDITRYESANKRWNPDMAVRYEHTIGDWDIGLAHFSGTSREPRLVATTNNAGAAILTPVYDIIHQTSADIQYTLEGWLWKLETISRAGHDRHFVAASGGFEYTFYSLGETNLDLGTLYEYHKDERSPHAPGTFTNNDSFLGLRLTLNDVNDTEFLAGVLVDHDTQATLISVEASRRVGNNWKIEFDLRAYANIGQNNAEAALDDDSHVQLRLARYF